ncbi:MAG: ATP-binding protein [Myxococcota bacterium]
MTELRTTAVDLSGLMTVLAKHLYSTPIVVVRELVQNAHDACTRRRIEDPGAPEGWIRLSPDEANGSLVVEDAGAGLTRDEIIDFLATVGRGYTRELRATAAAEDSEALIGLFGLGFLSAFAVASRVTVHTRSYQAEAEPWIYQSKDGIRYSLDQHPAPDHPVGLRVELELKPEHRVLADRAALKEMLEHYCLLLRVPVVIAGDERPLNADLPPWRDEALGPPQSLARKKRELAFAAGFERRFEPIAVIPVVAAEGSDARGLLWIQDGASYGNLDNRNLSVFVRGMLLDDDAKELLPSWASFVGGVIESSALTPTASREDLQRDQAYDATRRALSDTLTRGLVELARHQPDTWRRITSRHNEALLGAAVGSDELFAVLGDVLSVPTTEGDLGLREIAARSKGAIHVSLAGRGGFEEMLFKVQKVPVIQGTRYGALAFADAWCSSRSKTLVKLGTEEGDRRVFVREELPAEDLAYLKGLFAIPDTELVTARFQPAEVPLVLVPDRDAELKQRLESDQAAKKIGVAALAVARLYTQRIQAGPSARLFVNLGARSIRALLEARSADDRGRAEAAAKLLSAAVVLTSGTDSSSLDFGAALAEIERAALALLGGTR